MTEAGRDPAEVRHKANDTFQWFYEIDAGRGQEKLTAQWIDRLTNAAYDERTGALTWPLASATTSR